MVISNAHYEGKEVGICGELASDEFATVVLIGMGLDKLSMNSTSIPRVKKQIRKLKFQESKEFTENILKMSSSRSIRLEIKRFLRRS